MPVISGSTRNGFPLKACGNDGKSLNLLALTLTPIIYLVDAMNNVLRETLKARTDIKFSILFGSRAKGCAHEHSDWDIALFFNDNSDAWENIGKKEEIRRQIAKALKIEDQRIDLVDLYQCGFGISVTVVDEGVILSDQDNLALAYYYQGVWAKLEDYYWNIEHAA
jgi:predicted nucleotidyltransferase